MRSSTGATSLTAEHPQRDSKLSTMASRSMPKFTGAADMAGAEDAAQEWPGSFTVQHIVEGFHAMDNASKEHRSGKLTVAAAFSKVFDLPFKRATFYDNQKIWREAPERLRARFMRYDSLKKGSWGAFVRAVKRWDPEAPDSSSESDSDGPAWTPVFAADIAKSPTQAPATHDDIEYIDVSSAPNSPPPRITGPSPSQARTPTDLNVRDLPSMPTSVATVSSLSLSAPIPTAAPYELSREELEEMEEDPDADVLSDSSSEDGTPAPPGAELCPFCDKALPDNPSKTLLDRVARLMESSVPKPRRKNAQHRTYDFRLYDKVFRPYCEAHKRERRLQDLSKADGHGPGYPVQVDFEALPQRTARFVPALVDLIREPHAELLYSQVLKTYKPNTDVHTSMEQISSATAG